jgi:hypothetical protein
VKAPVTVATLGNITLSGLQTIDGYAVQAGDRVLVTVQDTIGENGIYNASAGAWTRSSDCPTLASMVNTLVASGPQGTNTYELLWIEGADELPDGVQFYPFPTAGEQISTDPANPAGTFQMNLRALYTGSLTEGGEGLIWNKGGATYGSAGSRAVGAWEASEDGTERKGAIPAPTDGSIQTGQLAEYYDDTNGAPAARFKGKTADGTAFSGIVLASPGSQTTVGAAGAASVLPAAPSTYIKVTDAAGNHYVIPAYLVS